MEDERQGNGPNVTIKSSPESTSRITPITTSTFTTNSSNVKNNNNNNNNNKSTSTKEQDRFLPIANVGRIMKKVIPGNGKISKDAKETVQECVSEFISFVTGEASDRCQTEKRKTINGDDIIYALTILGFDDYVAPLKTYLLKYRELEGEKLNVPKQQQQQQQHQQQQQQQLVQLHDHTSNMPSYNNVYSPTGLLPQASFLSTDQSFSLPFSQNSTQSQLTKQEQIDSVGHW